MEYIYLELLAILLLVLLNGYLALSELAVVSARKIRLQQRALEGDSGAGAALQLLESPEQFLSTVQIGITLIGVLSGAFGGATIAEELETVFDRLPIPLLSRYAEAISVSLVVLVVTYLTLILGELVPKQLALNAPETMAARVAPLMRLVSRPAAPIARLLSISSNLVLRVLAVKPSTDPEVTEEEVKLLISQAASGGVFEPEEEDLVRKVFRLADRPITAQMTPRTEIVWLDLDDSADQIQARIKESRFSIFPVGRGNIDNLLGIVHAKDMVEQMMDRQKLDLEAIFQQPFFLADKTTLLDAFTRFRETGGRMAVVIDEFGGIQGLTTITDILEAIGGDFQDAMAASDPEIVVREDGSYLLDGMLDIEAFKSLMELPSSLGEGPQLYQTLGGFVMAQLGRVPSSGDVFTYENLKFEVVDMDGLRVDKVLVRVE